MQNHYPEYFVNGEDRELDERLRRDINQAIHDEFLAISYYTQLAELAPVMEAKQAILGIRQDEIRHFNAFSQSYLGLSGSYPSFELVGSKDLPSNYRQSIRESIKEEMETVPFYISIANQLNDPRAKRRFMRAAFDEERHAAILKTL